MAVSEKDGENIGRQLRTFALPEILEAIREVCIDPKDINEMDAAEHNFQALVDEVNCKGGNGYLRHVKVTVHGSLAQFLSNFFSHDVEWFGEKRGDKEGMWKRMLFFFWGALPPVQRLETVMRIFGDRRGWKAKDGNIYVLQAGPYSEQMGNRANCLTVDCNSKNLSWTIHCAVTQFTSVGAYLTGADITPPDDSNDGVPKRYAAALS